LGFLGGLDRDEFTSRLAHYLGEVNALHPFRAGNGRAQRAFFGQLASDAGYTLPWQSLDPALDIEASAARHSWKSRVAIMRGRYLLGLSNANRQAAGVGIGDEVEVDVEVDAEPPVVVEPADFARALDADPVAGAACVLAIESAKKPGTRIRRIEKALEMLRASDGGGPG
jgi:hypothetical protein